MKTAQKIVNNSIKEKQIAIKGELIKITQAIFEDNPFI